MSYTPPKCLGSISPWIGVKGQSTNCNPLVTSWPPNACPVILSSDCVYYIGDTLPNTGIQLQNTLTEALEKIDAVLIGVSGDMDNMANMSNAKITPIDADNLTLWDSVAGQFKKLTIADSKTWLNTLYLVSLNSVDLASLKDRFKKVLTDTTVTTTQTLDWDAYSGFIFTMTGATTFNDSNLPESPNEDQITILMTGDFAATLPTYWKIGGDTYDGTGWNLLAIECKDNTGSSEQVICIISNLM